MRQAMVEALSNVFYAAYFVGEDDALMEAEEHPADKTKAKKKRHAQIHEEDGRGKRASEKRQTVVTTKKSAARPELQRQRSAVQKGGDEKHRSTREQLDLQAKVVGAHAVPACARDYKGTELLPDFVKKKVLTQHVYEMQHTFYARLTEWTRRKIEAQEAEDLHAMGFTDLDAQPRFLEPRPKPLEVGRLKGLYADTYDAWLRGDFRAMVMDRTRLTKKYFGVWRRSHFRVQEKRPTILGHMMQPIDFHYDSSHHEDAHTAPARRHRKQEKLKRLSVSGTFEHFGPLMSSE
jgi:hypothetical protein